VKQTNLMRWCRILFLPVLLLMSSVLVKAQANSALTGIVTDQTGAVVEGAKVVANNPETGATRSTVTNGVGLYEIGGLNAGNYDLKITAKGFETFAQKHIVVNVSNTFRVDVKLTIGSQEQTVTVEADALAVQGDSNVVSSLINEQQITELSTNGRNVVALAALGLGVSGNLPDSNMPTSVGSNFAISFNGLNQAHNNWLVDGGEIYDRGSGGKASVMPSQDALGEFQVLASNYPADYGISSGGTISMSLKAGTNTFHGEAWEFGRNDAFDAHSYFDNDKGQLTKKSELRYNVFGFNIGGPLVIPHFYNKEKNKTHFFYNEEWRRIINGQSSSPINTVPSADNVTTAADFDYVVPAFNNTDQVKLGTGKQLAVPYTNDPTFNAKLDAAGIERPTVDPTTGAITKYTYFANNKIPGSLLDPNALRFNALKNLPGATNANDTYTPTAGKLPTFVREDIVRIDHNINDKWQILGHFIHDSVSQNYATVLWNADSYPTLGSNFVNPSYSSVIKLTGSITPNLLLEAAFNYDGNKIQISPVTAGGSSVAQPSGWNAGTYFKDPIPGGRLPNITFGTFGTTWGPGSNPWHNGAEDFAETYGFTWTKGAHTIKFGGGYNRFTKNQIIGSSTEGSYTFGDGWDTDHPTGSLTGDSYLDFLFGMATNYSQANNDPVFHYVANTYSAYVDDNWHVNNRLSIQVGIRYDALPHVWERQNQISNFNPDHYQSALAATFDSSTGAISANSPGLQTVNGSTFYMNGIDIAGKYGTPRGLVDNFYGTYQPRLGFSYDLFGNQKTVLRGGVGTFFERMQGNDIYDIAGNAPFVNTPSANNVEFSNPSYNWQSGGAASTPLFPQAPNADSKKYPAPGVEMYSLGIQHEIAPALILVAQYVGNIAWHQNEMKQINNFPTSTPVATRKAYASNSLSTAQVQALRTYAGYGAIHQISNELTGSYNSLQVGLRQQNKHGLSFEVDYTYSHEIDDQPGSADLNTGSNPWNLKYDKGSGSLDRRHVVSANYEYKIPFMNTNKGLAHSILGGWEVSGVIIAETGLPWAGNTTPGSGYADTVGMGGGYTNFANISGSVVYPKKKVASGTNSGYRWVSNDNFSKPTAVWDGGTNMGFGNAGRDIIVGPGRTNFSTSLFKTFDVVGRAKFEVRAESFNTFNHTQFNAFNTTIANANFGYVTGAQDPRVFEFAGKFTF